MTFSSSDAPVLSASQFVGSIAVNGHVGFGWVGYDNSALVSRSMDYLGVTTMRDALSSLPQASPVVSALAEAGYKFDFVVSSSTPAGGTAALKAYVTALQDFEKAHPGSIVAVEGLNEANIQKFSYNGSSSMAAAGQFQRDFYETLKANGTLKDIPVYNLTLGHNSAADYAALGDMSAWSDYANAHAYVSTNSTVSASLSTSLGVARPSAGDAPTVITETGYTTRASTPEVGASEAAQAKSMLNTVVSAFKSGVEKTYLYELFDRGSDPAMQDKEAHFGLFDVDGSPKLAATAIHNLTYVLADDGKGGAQPDGHLSYAISGLPTTGDAMMLAKSNGAYDLVIWSAPKVWDDASDKDILNATIPVTVQFGMVQAKVYVYDPLQGSSPVAVYENVGQVVLPISDHPLIVEIGGPGPRVEQPVVTEPVVIAGGAAIIAELATLDVSTTLQKITLTDGPVIPVSSKATLVYILDHYQNALSKIAGDYQFSITQTAPTWQKIETYDSSGHLFSTADKGLKNGIVFTEQTKYADGSIQNANYTNGVKVNEQIKHVDGSKEVYNYGLKGADYSSEHASYDAGGKLVAFERLRADNSKVYTELYTGGHKIVTWYDAGGKAATIKDWAPDGSVTSKLYVDGVQTRLFVTNADNSGYNTTYGIKGQSYVTETQKVDTTGKVYEVLRSHADGSLDYHSVTKPDGTKITTVYDATGHKLNSVTVAANGDRSTDFFDPASSVLTRQVFQNKAGDFTTKEYAGGVLSSMTVAHADKSNDMAWYDAKGVVTKTTHQEANGYVETRLYTDGVQTRLFVTNPDKSGYNTTYGIKGQSYVTETQKVDTTGKVYEVVRTHADGSLDYDAITKPDGTKITTVYDAAGHKLNSVTVAANGDRSTDFFDLASGVLTKQVRQDKAGDFTTKEYAGGILSSVSVAHADKSSDMTWYDAKGLATQTTHQEANGYVETKLYTSGVQTRLTVTNPDKSGYNTTYGIKGQSYVTETQKTDASGKVYEVIRSHSDGTLDYHAVTQADGSKITTVYDATGHKLNTVIVEADGDRATELFDAASGNLSRQIMQSASGETTIKDYVGGVHTTTLVNHVDKSSDMSWYDAGGAVTRTTHQETSGYVETKLYTDGAQTRLFVTNPDKTGYNTSYGIQGQSYVTETQKTDASGKVYEVIRSHADGSPDYHWTLGSDGTRTTTNYDATGTRTMETVAHPDASKDVFKFALAGQPGAVQHEIYDTSGKLTITDVSNPDGTHKLYAQTSGVTLTGGHGDDMVQMFGQGAFVFTGGNDTMVNFHADETQSNHDAIQVSKSIAANFDSLQITKVGSDTFVAFNDHDSILLKGIGAAHVTAADFLFV
ncbi:RHS repeat protein [Bosea sp. ASV33]|uniref:RHS repeat protein n=1 Tax=Bosea sp. ASV33 TaxID=2795106 RepID=UPI0018ECDF42|nr:RHS repeat protein [Bosea sp. ASV33]